MDDVERVQMLGQSYQRLKTELAKRIVGQEAAIESLLICLLAGGIVNCNLLFLENVV